jgi:GNAT superfamily N-acetyltransferase
MPRKNSVLVRLAAPDDVHQLADLRWRLQTDDAEVLDIEERNRFVTEFANSVLARFRDESLIHWVAEFDGRIVAVMSVATVRKVPSPKSISRHWGYLTNCYTLPEFRNMGIGSRLMSAVRVWATSQKYEFLAVWPSDRSYPFYERSGFHRYADPLILKIEDKD